mgnify:CR=1 FL=1
MNNAEKHQEIINATLKSIRQLWKEVEHFGLRKTEIEKVEDACNEFFNLLEPIQYQIEMKANTTKSHHKPENDE